MKKFFRYCFKRKISALSFTILLILYFFMIFAEFMAPYRADTFFDQYPNHPPSWTIRITPKGFGMYVQKSEKINSITREYVRVKNEWTKVKLFSKGPTYKLWGIFKGNIHFIGTPYFQDGNSMPVFIFGTDNLGRDIFSRTIYGSRISLTIGFIAVSISLFIAILFGGFAGFYGGFIDWIIMRISELFILIPSLYLILFLRSVLSRNLTSGQSYVLITVLLAFVSWPSSARLIRGLVHSIKREDFVLNAKLENIPSIIILFRHILPQMSSIILISATLSIPGFILSETVLSYLGLGIVDPAVSWGSLINREVATINNFMSFPWLAIPGIFLILTTLAFNFIGELLRDIYDPNFLEKF